MTNLIIQKNIVIEGMDGSGKETQSKLLQRRLGDMGLYYDRVPFPQYGLFTGDIVRRYLRKNKTVNKRLSQIKDDSLLYTFNRFQYFADKIENGFDINRFIFDRYTTSNMLYQSLNMTEEVKKEYVEWLTELEYDILRMPKPDIVIVLTCSEQLATENVIKRGLETDFFESVEMQSKVRKNIEFFVKEYNWVPIEVDKDGEMRSIESINDEILSILTK